MATDTIKKITALKLAGIIAVTGIGLGVILKLNRKSPVINQSTTSYTWEAEIDDDTTKIGTIVYDENENTTGVESTVQNDNIETTTSIEEKTTNIQSGSEEKISNNSSDISYDQLFQKLSDVINEKNFDSSARKIIIDHFNKVYENYDSFYEVYKINGIYDKETYIEKMIIENLEQNINRVSLEDGLKVGLMQKSVVGNYNNGVIRLDKNYATAVDYGHEANHATKGTLGTMDIKRSLYKILVEGEATWSEATCSNEFALADPILLMESQTEGYGIKGIESSDTSYTLYSKCYAMLASIVDYKVLQSIKEEENINNIINYINSNYSIDGNEFITEMTNLCNWHEMGNKEKALKSVTTLEKSINKCFYERALKISTADELISFINMKRYYDMQYSTESLVNYEDEYTFDIAQKSELDPYGVNDILYQKAIDLNAFPRFSDNESKNRQVFGSIMGESEDHFSYYSYGEQISISNLGYTLSPDESSLTLYDGTTPIVQYDYNAKRVYRDSDEIDYSQIGGELTKLVSISRQKVM